MPFSSCTQRNMKAFVADKLSEGDVTSSPGRNNSVGDCELISRLVPLRRRHRDERLSRGCGSLSEITCIEVCRRRLAARRRSFVRSGSCIALNELHALKWNTQFFRDQLSLGGEHSLAKIAFASECGDGTIAADCDPRVKLAGIDVRRVGIKRTLRSSVRQQPNRTNAHDQRAGILQKIATRNTHAFLALAYLRIAPSIRRWTKQRHNTPLSASRISSSVAPGFSSSTAFAVRITPLRQNPHWAAPSSMKAC